MKLFLVRHGVTEEAEQDRRQYPTSALSEEGIRQARAAAKRLAKESVDLILSSEWKRCVQTAEVIAVELGQPVKVFEGIHEKEVSPDLHGTTFNDPINIEHDREMQANWGNMDWKFRNEGESLREVTLRAGKFRDHLIAEHAGQNVLAVSHSGFIRGFVTAAILGDDACDSDMLKLWLSLAVRNTGITLLEYNEDSKLWRLFYFNDHLHLV